MLELLDTIVENADRRLVLATLTDVEHSAPRDAGAAMLVSGDGAIWGSISGGCVEAALVHEAEATRETSTSRLVTYGVSDADAQAVGLTCGGTLHVFLERVNSEVFASVRERSQQERLLALAMCTSGAYIGARLFIFETGQIGTLGEAALDAAVGAGELTSGKGIFVQYFHAPPDMYVFGAIDFTRATVRIAKFLGYRVTVCDARPAFTNAERFPEADRVVVQWPHEFLQDAPVDDRTAIIVLTHDEKFDIPLLQTALATRAAYIGVMGSRRTHARRMEHLREIGLREDQLERLCAPIGLDIGARTPQETAVAIAAEIVALRNARSGGRLTGGEGSVRGRALQRS